jgi:hypothetical protein
VPNDVSPLIAAGVSAVFYTRRERPRFTGERVSRI